jgi:hypothetical protein
MGNTTSPVRRAAMVGAVLALCVACTGRDAATQEQPQAGQPLDPLTTASRLAAVQVASALGEGEVARAQFEAVHADLMRSMKIADARRPIDREAARTAAHAVAGVRSVAWVDRHNLLALVEGQGHRTQQTIDRICRGLEPLGDTLAVVVHLQDATARTGDELETISRNCQLTPGDVALFQTRRQLDVIDPTIRARHKAVNTTAPDVEASQRRADEAMRLLEAGTPSM